MSTVYVLNKDGKPLMPTTRGGHVRHLLKEQKARVARTKPFLPGCEKDVLCIGIKNKEAKFNNRTRPEVLRKILAYCLCNVN